MTRPGPHQPLSVRRRGRGTPIVLCHGNSCSSRSFEKQLDSALADRFQLVAIELPGHGDSPPASSPERDYSLGGHAAAVAAAVRELDVSGAVFVGWSLGGHVLLEASALLPEAAGFFIFGAPPIATLDDFSRATFDAPGIEAAFREDCSDEEVRAFASCLFRPGYPVPQLFIDDFRRTDPRARSFLAANAAEGKLRDEVRIVEELEVPLAVVHGVRERVVRRGYFDQVSMPTLWRGAVQEIAGAGHAPQWETPERFNELLADFALDCARSG